ncbi:hypothetical protein MKW98_014853 [Papaver atlanticum]|uniref:Uncharacterized protein n=1 Tax=Papaver atlanticum TaxID=357466 RepID=A0AAD4SFK8_9MAGN|nr:hypothetical protein MKW98_014853 [Papaver atlanticum]
MAPTQLKEKTREAPEAVKEVSKKASFQIGVLSNETLMDNENSTSKRHAAEEIATRTTIKLQRSGSIVDKGKDKELCSFSFVHGPPAKDLVQFVQQESPQNKPPIHPSSQNPPQKPFPHSSSSLRASNLAIPISSHPLPLPHSVGVLEASKEKLMMASLKSCNKVTDEKWTTATSSGKTGNSARSSKGPQNSVHFLAAYVHCIKKHGNPITALLLNKKISSHFLFTRIIKDRANGENKIC